MLGKISDLVILAICCSIFLCGCAADRKEISIPKIFSPEPPVTQTDIYFDSTVSMRGFTKLRDGNVYLKLPDLLGDMCSSTGTVNFFAFGADIRPLEGRTYRQFATPDVYNELITAVANVVDAADTDHLSIIVTDLFESDSDWSNVTQKLRDKFFAKNLTVAVIGIRNSFYGEIFDVGLNAAKFEYNSWDDPNRYRPFYLLVLGRDGAVKNFLRDFKERQSLPEDTGYLILSDNLTDAPKNFSSVPPESDLSNFVRDTKFAMDSKDTLEVAVDKFSSPATFKMNFICEPADGVCAIDRKNLIVDMELFSSNDGKNWQAVPIDKADFIAKVEPVANDKGADEYSLEFSFTPEKILNRDAVNFLHVSLRPSKSGYDVQQWVKD